MQIHQLELLVEPLLGVALVRGARLVAVGQLGQADRGQRLKCRPPSAPLEIWKLVAQVLGQVEATAALGDPECGGERIGARLEAGRHFRGRRQMEERVRSAEPVRAVQRSTTTDRDQYVLEAVPLGTVVVDVAGGNHRNIQPIGQRSERLQTRPVSLHLVVLEFHEHPLLAERLDQSVRERFPFGHARIESGG